MATTFHTASMLQPTLTMARRAHEGYNLCWCFISARRQETDGTAAAIVNHAKLHGILRELLDEGTAYQLHHTVGMYKGEEEYSFAALLPEVHMASMFPIARAFQQESILVLTSEWHHDTTLAGHLHYMDSRLCERLPGRFTTFASSANIPANVDAYTRFTDGSAFAFI